MTVDSKNLDEAQRVTDELNKNAAKIRELLNNLEKAGFINRGGKGSHRNYEHPSGARITISGGLGDNAKPYQEKLVKQKLGEV